MSIAGSDPVAGAGIQADIKTFHAFDIYCATVITSVVIQSTEGVFERRDLSPEAVEQQLKAVLRDLDIKVVKIGVLPTKKIVKVVKKHITDYTVVFDPVIFSSSGYRLMDEEAVDYLRKSFFSDIFLITPNREEAAILAGMEMGPEDQIKKACKVLHETGARNILITGTGRDILYNGKEFREFASERIEKDVHGTGCTFSSAIAANLAEDRALTESVKRAKEYITGAIKASKNIGKGQNVIDHFYKVKKKAERYQIIKDLKEAYKLLKEEDIHDLIPEVQSNLVFALKNADSAEEVAGFPGRIIKVNEDITTVSAPEFGASRHMANLILETMKYSPKTRSVMNIKYSKLAVRACKDLQYNLSFIDRKKEPKSLKEKEGKTLKWEIEEVFKQLKIAPDLIYDTGDIGKEAMIRVLGETPREVAEKVIKIKRKIRS